MKRVAALAVGAGLLGAGLLTASGLSGTSRLFGESTDTTSTAATTDTTTTPSTTSASTASAPAVTLTTSAPRQKLPQISQRLADGVTVGGVHVGGLGADAAYQAVRLAFDSPLELVANDRRLEVTPEALGAVAYVKSAISEARRAGARTAVQLRIHVQGDLVAAYVKSLARKLDRQPVDTSVVLRNLKPRVTTGVSGWMLDRKRTAQALIEALAANRRSTIRLPLRELKPKLAAAAFPIVVIRRNSNKLFLYAGVKLVRLFHVATGQAAYPTPLGRFQILVKWENPWWYPPASPWARGKQPVPPGPGNPLGTRWMGLSSPGVGIHGTPDSASIGYSLSHGCIRMFIPEAEWLFDHVDIGTPVFIVAA